MRTKRRNNGSVFLIVIFVIAFMAALVMGIAQINSEEIQLAGNQINAVQALAVAEAGLNDAFSEIRTYSSWTTGFNNKSFNGGLYTVTVTGTLPNLVIQSTGTSSLAFVARVGADITVGTTSPYVIRIDNFRINE